MALPNIFTESVTNDIISRIEKLTPETRPLWGKMGVAEMLAHCCVTYEYVFEPNKYKKNNAFVRFILKLLVKPKVVGEAGYPQNGNTGPDFIIKDTRDFATEKARLIAFIQKTQKMGATAFEGKESHSFGPLTAIEWNNMFYKHLAHHLGQFGV